jgi:zinc D-Ala-D-Ala dipeptidase
MLEKTMTLVAIAEQSHDVVLDLAYATPNNFTGKPVYARPLCFLHLDAAAKLEKAIALAKALDLRVKIFDAFRPSEAQWELWNHTPDPTFLADPRRGSPHSRGAAIDLTLIDAQGRELDMGTAFDAFTPQSHHASTAVSTAAQRNRFLLLGLMSAAGWDFYGNEWWHYQLFDAKRYPLLGDADAPERMMPNSA